MPIKTVLVVDDSPTDRQYLLDLLAKNGYQASAAESAEEALAKVRQERPDLVLMDVVMPGQNGFQATRALSRDQATKDIPVIICTSKGQETDRIWGLRQGARDYIVKPVEAADLLASIGRDESVDRVSISAADPLNLVGIAMPGERVPALARNRVLFEQGVPIAVQAGGEVRFLRETPSESQWAIRSLLIRRKGPESVLPASPMAH